MANQKIEKERLPEMASGQGTFFFRDSGNPENRGLYIDSQFPLFFQHYIQVRGKPHPRACGAGRSALISVNVTENMYFS